MYIRHENEQKTEQLPRVLQVEKVTFTPSNCKSMTRSDLVKC